ncbi:MAG: SRPBCC family protein [Actinobacteria bacterium]|nr:SRPBCC family protein [Actinomycetota bacterium]MBS1884396.1 SRPBCC family protein [Actinomycetota bacterium]
MGPISAEVEVDASREAAFALISDLARRPNFTDHFLTGFHLTRIEARGEGAGARFRVNAPLRSPWEDTTIVALEEPFKIEERGAGGRSNRIPNRTVWEIEPGRAGMTLLRVTHWTTPDHPIDKLVESLSWAAHFQRKRWKRALERLRDILEAEGPAGERIAVAGGNRYATGIP